MIKCAILGAGGNWSPNIIRNVLKFKKELQLCYLVDLEKSKLDKYENLYKGVEVTTDINDIIKDKEIEIVFIATPIGTHFFLTKKLLEAGKNCLVQKPLCTTRKECEDLYSLAKRNKVKLGVCHTYCFSEPIKYVKDNLNQLGNLQYYSSVRVNLGLFSRTHNVLYDLMHDFSIISYLFPNKNIQYVSATGAIHLKDGMVDFANISIGFNDNFIANVSLNWISAVKIRQIFFGGSRKTILFDDCDVESKLKIYDCSVDYDDNERFLYKKGTIFCPKLNDIESIYSEIEDFLRAVKTNTQPLADFEHTFKVISLIEAANESIKENGKPIVFV